jgi:hypothetical protein
MMMDNKTLSGVSRLESGCLGKTDMTLAVG